MQWHGLAPALAALCIITLGCVVMNGGWIRHQVASLRQTAYETDLHESIASLKQKRALLETAVELTPEDADLHTELADVYAELYRKEPGSARQYLAPALDHYLQARDRAPILPGPQLGLALHADRLTAGDAPQTYRNRVQRLAPADPTFWYYSGNQELRLGHPENAWRSWRRCLGLSDRYLDAILARSKKFLATSDLVDFVLPDQPSLILEAAARLFPPQDRDEGRKLLLKRALTLLDAQQTPLTPKEIRTKALCYQGLGRGEEAVQMYKTLVQREPSQANWRFELAQVLYQDGRLEEARSELATVLAQQPANTDAYKLWTQVLQDQRK